MTPEQIADMVNQLTRIANALESRLNLEEAKVMADGFDVKITKELL